MPRVNIEEEAFSDQRVELLGELAGYNRFEALGRLAHLWRITTQRGQYVVSDAIVAACLGPKGPEALVVAELGERVDDGIRIRGTEGRIEWVQDKANTKQAGGRARAAGAPRDSRGRLLPRDPAGQISSSSSPAGSPAGSSSAGPADLQQTQQTSSRIQQGPAAGAPRDSRVVQQTQQTTSRDPADSSALLSSGSDLSPVLSSLPPELPDLGAAVRAEREAFKPAALPARTRDDLRRKLFGDAWLFAGLKFTEAKNAGLDPHARNCWSGLPAASSSEAEALFARIDELAPGDTQAEFARAGEVIRNRVLVAFANAKRPDVRHLKFCIPARMWNADSFAIDKDLSVEQASQPRAGPKPALRIAPPEPPPIKRPTYR